MVIRPGTRICAFVAGMPGRSPAARAAASAAVTTLLFPSRPIITNGATAGGAASPAVRRSRSVGQSGRYSETTRLIASLQLEISTLARLGADQLDQPAMAADAPNRQRLGRKDGDTPARHGGGRRAEIGRIAMPAPAPQRDADRSGAFGGELEPARCRHWQSGDLTDDGAEAAMAKAFLHARQDGLVVAGLDIDDAVGGKACLGERRREQVRLGDAPQRLAGRASRDSGREESCRRPIDRAITAAGNLMQRAARQAAAGESRIDLGNPERKHRFRAPGPPFEAGDPLPKFDNR
jgi:hypothetical protein